MTQNQPKRVTYSGLRARGRSPTGVDTGSEGPVSAGVQRRLGFREGEGAVKGQKWPIFGLNQRHVATCGATSRRDRGQTSPRRDVAEGMTK